MPILVIALHGIMTRQTDPSWPDQLDAWMFRRDPRVKVLKKEYRAGPFPRWNCWVKDPWLARSLANEIELFLGGPNPGAEPGPAVWFVAHSNGAVVALLAARRLIERGHPVRGLILTGAACEADILKSRILDWVSLGRLGAAIAYSSEDDQVLAGDPAHDPKGTPGLAARARSWLWGKAIWPYGCLGRTGWLCGGRPLAGAFSPSIFTRWFRGGHSAYFAPATRGATFERIYEDIRGCGAATNPQGGKMNPTDATRPLLRGPAAPLAGAVVAQLPAPAPGAIESWLLSAAAVLSLVVLAKKLFVRKPSLEAEFATKVEVRQMAERADREVGDLRERFDSGLAALGGKLDQVRADLLEAGERRAESIHRRLNELEAGLARVDERTKL